MNAVRSDAGPVVPILAVGRDRPLSQAPPRFTASDEDENRTIASAEMFVEFVNLRENDV